MAELSSRYWQAAAAVGEWHHPNQQDEEEEERQRVPYCHHNTGDARRRRPRRRCCPLQRRRFTCRLAAAAVAAGFVVSSLQRACGAAPTTTNSGNRRRRRHYHLPGAAAAAASSPSSSGTGGPYEIVRDWIEAFVMEEEEEEDGMTPTTTTTTQYNDQRDDLVANITVSKVGSDDEAKDALWGDIDCSRGSSLLLATSLCMMVDDNGDTNGVDGYDDDDERIRRRGGGSVTTLWGMGSETFTPSEYESHGGRPHGDGGGEDDDDERVDIQQLPALGGSMILAYSRDVTGNFGVVSSSSEEEEQEDGDDVGRGLNMTFDVIGGIFNGTITMWDEESLQTLNPNIVLPHERITVFVRGDDGSSRQHHQSSSGVRGGEGMSSSTGTTTASMLEQAMRHNTGNDSWSAGQGLPGPGAGVVVAEEKEEGGGGDPSSMGTSRLGFGLRNTTVPTSSSSSNNEYYVEVEGDDGPTGTGAGLVRTPYSIGFLDGSYYQQTRLSPSNGDQLYISQVHISTSVHPTTFVKSDATSMGITMHGLSSDLHPDTLELPYGMSERDTPMGGYPLTTYAFRWYIKKRHTSYQDCQEAWYLYKFVEWCYTSRTARNIAWIKYGYVVPPPSVVGMVLDKLGEIQCIVDATTEEEGGTPGEGGGGGVSSSVVNVEEYRPPVSNGGGDDVGAVANEAAGYQGAGDRPTSSGTKLAIALYSVVAIVFGLFLLSCGAYVVRRKGRAIHKLTREHDDKMESILDAAAKAREDIKYPFTLITADDFIQGGRLVVHEQLRDDGKLIMYDSVRQVESLCDTNPVVFISHQWTSFYEPDPTNVQYRTMVAALRSVVTEMGWDMSKVLIWVDYSCIPQRMEGLQSLAVQSLATYSSTADAFIVAAPTCTHRELGTTCDDESYRRRAWCRAEQTCHILLNGPQHMYVATSEDGIEEVQESWVQQALRIFQGDLTCCQRKHHGMKYCDRERLVIPLLGLFGELYRNSLLSNSSMIPTRRRSVHIENWSDYAREFLEEIERNKNAVFPGEFQKVTTKKLTLDCDDREVAGDVVEDVTLFGDLVDRIKERIEAEVHEHLDMQGLLGNTSRNIMGNLMSMGGSVTSRASSLSSRRRGGIGRPAAVNSILKAITTFRGGKNMSSPPSRRGVIERMNAPQSSADDDDSCGDDDEYATEDEEVGHPVASDRSRGAGCEASCCCLHDEERAGGADEATCGTNNPCFAPGHAL